MSLLPLSSLRARSLVLVVAALFPGLGIILAAAQRDQRRETDEAKGQMLLFARAAALDADRVIEGAHQLLVALSRLPEVRGPEPSACSALMADLRRRYPQYANLGAARRDGTIACSAIPLSASVSLAGSKHILRAVETGDFAVGEHTTGPISGRLVLPFAYPVLDDVGRPTGAVVATLDLLWLNEWAARVSIPPHSAVTLLDETGAVLALHPRADGGSATPGPELVATILASAREAVAEGLDADGTYRLYAFAHVGPRAHELHVAVGQPRRAVLAGVRREAAENLATLGLVAALALAGAWIGGARLIVRPIGRLLDATRRLGGGDLHARTGLPHGPDEIGQLARAYDGMAASLEEHDRQRGEAETSLRESEQRFRAVFDSALDAVLVMDDERRYVDGNPAACVLFGVDRERLLGSRLGDFSESAAHADDAWAALRGTGRFRGEYRLQRPDGTIRDVEVQATAAFLPGRNLAVIRDITDRKRAEEALQARERQQAVVADLGQRALAGLDLDALFGEAASVASRTLDVELCKVLELLPDGTALRLRAGVGWRDGCLGSATVSAALGSQAGYTLASNQPVILEDLGTETRFTPPPLLLDHGVVSGLSVVIPGEERPFGVLGAHTARRRSFTRDDAHFLQAIANVLASAILRRRQDEIRLGLFERVLAVQEEERRRIARELHDEIGQVLTAVKISLERLQRAGDTAAASPGVPASIASVDRAIQQVRGLSLDLRPPSLDQLGLAVALEWYVDRQTRDAPVEAHVLADPMVPEHLSPETEIVCFRVAQEALTNVLRHARARRVEVELRVREAELALVVRDDGVGFDLGAVRARAAAGECLGLSGMQERVALAKGRLEVRAAPGSGTEVRAFFPLAAPHEGPGDHGGGAVS